LEHAHRFSDACGDESAATNDAPIRTVKLSYPHR
jgi:hypothetical protein